MRMPKKRKQKENLERLEKALGILQQVYESPQTPRNVRKVVKDSLDMLKNDEMTPAVRAANVMSMLDEVMQDPNMPSFIRVTLWNTFSILEGIRE